MAVGIIVAVLWPAHAERAAADQGRCGKNVV